MAGLNTHRATIEDHLAIRDEERHECGGGQD